MRRRSYSLPEEILHQLRSFRKSKEEKSYATSSRYDDPVYMLSILANDRPNTIGGLFPSVWLVFHNDPLCDYPLSFLNIAYVSAPVVIRRKRNERGQGFVGIILIRASFSESRADCQGIRIPL
jgi:hypothetical protein